jgi:hypothetical protein
VRAACRPQPPRLRAPVAALRNTVTPSWQRRGRIDGPFTCSETVYALLHAAAAVLCNAALQLGQPQHLRLLHRTSPALLHVQFLLRLHFCLHFLDVALAAL